VPGKAGGRCRFCGIIQGEGPAFVVLDDEASLAFLDKSPLLPGHCLLVPRRHYPTLLDVPPDELGPLFTDAQRLARAVETAMAADGSFVAVNTRISQSVMHLHVHVVPRWKDDKLFSPKLIWKRRPYRDEDRMREIADAIRSALENPA
jgi:histidine triad (HIT) family protein